MRDLINLIEAVQTGSAVTRETIVAALNKLGFEHDNIKISGNKIAVLTQIPDGEKKNEYRKSVLDSIATDLEKLAPDLAGQVELRDDLPDLSSVGYIAIAGSPAKIIVKDAGVQGDKSAGVGNEAELGALIQSVVEKYKTANVTFKDPQGNVLSMKNVTEVILSGKDVEEGKKADIILASKNSSRLPISLKQLDAEAWESAEGSFGERAKEIVAKLDEEGAIHLTKTVDGKGRTNYTLDKEIVVEPTEEESMRAIFGSDLNPEGGIVIQTFKPEHFAQNKNDVIVDCHAIIKSKADIPESHLMVWLIRNGAGRWPSGYRGLRPMGVILTRALGKRGDKDVVLVDKDGNLLKGGNPNAKKKREKADVEPLKTPDTETGSEQQLGRKRRK
jgi:hypothetical protein